MLNELAQTIVEPKSQAVACEVEGETVILDMASGQYFALDAIGSAVWRHLQRPSTVQSICQRLMEEYDVSADRCESDVSALIRQLEQHGLVGLSS